jgi:hypothetical protein
MIAICELNGNIMVLIYKPVVVAVGLPSVVVVAF